MPAAKSNAPRTSQGSKTRSTSSGFSEQEREAMRARAREYRAAAKAAREDPEGAAQAAYAQMSEPDRSIGRRLHQIIRENAPALQPRTWYGMPAYTRDGEVVCFVRGREKFGERYMTLGFNDSATLDEGPLWPVSFAISELTPAVEAKVAALVKRAAGRP